MCVPGKTVLDGGKIRFPERSRIAKTDRGPATGRGGHATQLSNSIWRDLCTYGRRRGRSGECLAKFPNLNKHV